MDRQEIENNIRFVENRIGELQSLIDFAYPNTPHAEIERWRSEIRNYQIRLDDLINARNNYY